VEIQPGQEGPADVFVDDERWPEALGSQPMLLELPAGKYRIRVVKEGFDTFSREVAVVEDEVEIIRVYLQRTRVAVRLLHLLPADVRYRLPAWNEEGVTPARLMVPVGEQIFEVDGRLFCFRIQADSAAYIRIRGGEIDELQRTTECEVPPDWLASASNPTPSNLYRLQPPVPRGMIIPPDNDRLRGTESQMWVFVNESGLVVPDSTRLEPPTQDSDFNRRLIREAQEWTFRPALVDGTPVSAWFTYRFRF